MAESAVVRAALRHPRLAGGTAVAATGAATSDDDPTEDTSDERDVAEAGCEAGGITSEMVLGGYCESDTSD